MQVKNLNYEYGDAVVFDSLEDLAAAYNQLNEYWNRYDNGPRARTDITPDELVEGFDYETIQ